MSELISNDNERAHLPHSQAHGQAAVLLVESLIHGLIARSVLSVEDGLEIVGVASEVANDLADEPHTPARGAPAILASINASLSNDIASDK